MACKIKYTGQGDITAHKGWESLEITCKLRNKIPGKALGTKIPHQLPLGGAFAFSCSPWRGLVAQSPRSARMAQPGTCQGLTFPCLREWLWHYQEPAGSTRKHQEKPLGTHRALDWEQISSKGEGNWNSELRLKRSTTQQPLDGTGYFWST